MKEGEEVVGVAGLHVLGEDLAEVRSFSSFAYICRERDRAYVSESCYE